MYTLNNKTMNCPKCKSEDVLLMEYSYDHPEHYDGVSEIYCNKCNKRYGRWSGKELKEGEFETVFNR